jgi:5-methylthioribose kinase
LSTTSYELLTVDTVAAYVAEQPHLVQHVDPRTLAVREVGDGNLNLVFLCLDGLGRGLCLKQALPYVRLVGAGWPLTPERAAAEARAYQVSSRLAADYIPAFYGFDAQRYIVAMEALTDWTVWRTALNDGQVHAHAAADLGHYVARVAFGTSLFGLDAAAHKARLAEAINPELCKITEDLVFTEPYLDLPNNSFVPVLAPTVDDLRGDSHLTAAVQGLKYAFMTRAEALIHGDLHTGSVMVSPHAEQPQARVIDPEFCFYGPVGFDLGALFGKLPAGARPSAGAGSAGNVSRLAARAAVGHLAGVRGRDVAPVAEARRHVVRRQLPAQLAAPGAPGRRRLRRLQSHPAHHRAGQG